MTGSEIHVTECRCPTCRNAQHWSDECRRCGTDLSLLRRLADESGQLHRVLFAALTANDFPLAERTLQRLSEISPTPVMELLLRFVKSRKTDDS